MNPSEQNDLDREGTTQGNVTQDVNVSGEANSIPPANILEHEETSGVTSQPPIVAANGATNAFSPTGVESTQPANNAGEQFTPVQQPVAPTAFNQPAATAFTPGLGAPAKKRSKLPWILGGLLVLLVLLGAGAYAAYSAYQSPEKVLSDAMLKVVRAESMQLAGSVSSDAKITNSGQTVAFKSLTFDSNSQKSPRGDANAKAIIGVNGNDYEFSGSAMLNDNGDIYFKITKAVDTLNKLYETMANGQKLPANALTTFRSLENKWVKVTIDDIRKQSSEDADAYKCALDAYKTFGKDTAMMDEVVAVYKKHPFLKTKGDAKYKDGAIGYEVSIDEKVSYEFGDAMDATAIGKKLTACDKNADQKDKVKSTTSEASKDTTTDTIVWVDQWSHELRKVESTVKYTPKDGDASTTKVLATFGFASKQSAVPTDTMSIDDFTKKVEEGYNQLVDGMSQSR